MAGEVLVQEAFKTMARRRETQAGREGASVPDGTPSPSPAQKRRYRRRLSNLRHVVSGLADVVRELEGGERPPGDGRALVYAYATLSNTLVAAREQDEMGERIARLEERVEELIARVPAAPTAARRPALLNFPNPNPAA